MSTELKNKIEEDLKKRNLTPNSVLQTIKNSINGIVCYAKDGKSILIYCIPNKKLYIPLIPPKTIHPMFCLKFCIYHGTA